MSGLEGGSAFGKIMEKPEFGRVVYVCPSVALYPGIQRNVEFIV